MFIHNGINAIIDIIAAMCSIVGLIISVVTKEKMAIVFYASAGIIIISVLLTIFVVIKSGKNDKMKEALKEISFDQEV